MSEPDWDAMRKTVLIMLHSKYDIMSESKKNLKYVVFQDPITMETWQLSPNETMNEVTNLSELGRKIIAAEINKMQKMQ